MEQGQLLEAVKLGITMRAAQRAYFRSRTSEQLIASKAAERAFDMAAESAVAEATGTATEFNFKPLHEARKEPA